MNIFEQNADELLNEELANLKIGDVIRARRYRNWHEKELIPEEHAYGYFIIIKNAHNQVYGIFCTSKYSNQNYDLYELSDKKNFFPKTTYARLNDIQEITPFMFLYKATSLSLEELSYIKKRLYINSYLKDFYKINCLTEEDYKIKLEKNDIIKIDDNLFLIYKIDDTNYYCKGITFLKDGQFYIGSKVIFSKNMISPKNLANCAKPATKKTPQTEEKNVLLENSKIKEKAVITIGDGFERFLVIKRNKNLIKVISLNDYSRIFVLDLTLNTPIDFLYRLSNIEFENILVQTNKVTQKEDIKRTRHI